MTNSDMNFCRLTCWGLGLLSGLLIAAVLALLMDFSTLMALLIGIICFLVIGYLLARFVCAGSGNMATSTLGAAGAVGAAGVAGAASAAGSARETASNSAEAVSARVSGDLEGTTASAEASTAATQDTGSTSGSAAAGSSASAAVSSGLQPSARLAGQEELASRKGSWKYEASDAGADDAAAAKAKADASAAAAAAKAKADADASAAAAAAKAKADASAAAAAAKAAADAKAAAAKAKADAKANAASAKATADAEAAAAKAKAAADAKAAKAKAADAKPKAAAAKTKASAASAGATGSGSKPAALKGARSGKADDLKKINGVGPKLEGTLNGMGVYHYDQIAGWSDKELEWVDGNLEGFYGRASRDEWIPQAKVLAGQGDAGGNRDYDGDGIIEGTNEGSKPKTLTAARGGKADNLKEIKGIGPKMEKLCNKLGFYHFDQIAAWNRDEVAWVDANLEGFRGRVTRDEWVAQAKVLAAGGETEFSKRVEDGGVY